VRDLTIIAGAMLLFSFVGLAGAAWLLVLARRERHEAERHRLRALVTERDL
jgi:hypothetical protein